MTVLNRIRKVYAEQGLNGHFAHDLNEHLQKGYVLHTPYASLMGFSCRRDDVLQAMVDGRTFTPKDADDAGDCWFVWIGVGDLGTLLSLTPFRKPWIAFARRGRIRVWRTEEITKRVATVMKSR